MKRDQREVLTTEPVFWHRPELKSSLLPSPPHPPHPLTPPLLISLRFCLGILSETKQDQIYGQITLILCQSLQTPLSFAHQDYTSFPVGTSVKHCLSDSVSEPSPAQAQTGQIMCCSPLHPISLQHRSVLYFVLLCMVLCCPSHGRSSQ